MKWIIKSNMFYPLESHFHFLSSTQMSCRWANEWSVLTSPVHFQFFYPSHKWQGQLRVISTNIRYAAVRRRYRKFSFFLKWPFSRKTCYKGLQICIKIWQSHFVSWLFQILSLKGYDGLPWSTCCILFGRGGGEIGQLQVYATIIELTGFLF